MKKKRSLVDIFSDNMAMFQEDRGISCCELAKRLGISKRQLSRYRNCQVKTALSFIEKLSEELDVEASQLLKDRS